MDTLNIHPGAAAEQIASVTRDKTARHLGSGGVEVFATPAMIALMEGAAVAALDPHLPQGQASVGTAIVVCHLAATPLGDEVRARAEVTAVDGRQVEFRVQAWDSHELIGEGTHTRFVIDAERFLRRVEEKAARR